MDSRNTVSSDNFDFKYSIGEKEEVVIILFSGKVTEAELPVLEKCAAGLAEWHQRIVLFDFKGVTAFSSSVHPFLVNFQLKIRSLGKFFGICGLRPEVKSSLEMSGIIRASEVFFDISDAWRVLASKAQSTPNR
jgi:anti-anti-sigma regulatory factor